MKYKYIEPEVSGELGDKTVLDNAIFPPKIKDLHYEFCGWLGSDIIESFPVYIVTDRLKIAIEKTKLSGVIFSDLTVTTSNLFKEMHPNIELPEFYWMQISGIAGNNDFGMSKDNRLVISSDVIDLLKQFNISDAVIEDYNLI
jgi:hypothetical protein